jgi:hypothetical protein
MLEKIFQKAMGFLQQPKKAFDSEKKTEVMEGFIYMAVLSIVLAVLSGAMTLFSPISPGAFAIAAIVGIYIGGVVFSVIGGLWLHLWAYIFGAKKGLHQTLKTVFYAGTPNYLLGWIPFIGMIFGLWTLYLDWIGLQRLQAMPGDKAALAIIIAFIIPMIVAAILFMIGLALFSSYAGTLPQGMLPPGFEMPG